jgi:hypothetical protein
MYASLRVSSASPPTPQEQKIGVYTRCLGLPRGLDSASLAVASEWSSARASEWSIRASGSALHSTGMAHSRRHISSRRRAISCTMSACAEFHCGSESSGTDSSFGRCMARTDVSTLTVDAALPSTRGVHAMEGMPGTADHGLFATDGWYDVVPGSSPLLRAWRVAPTITLRFLRPVSTLQTGAFGSGFRGGCSFHV